MINEYFFLGIARCDSATPVYDRVGSRAIAKSLSTSLYKVGYAYLIFSWILSAQFFGNDYANGIILVLKPLPDKIEKIYSNKWVT
jgi:hypothetical protein